MTYVDYVRYAVTEIGLIVIIALLSIIILAFLSFMFILVKNIYLAVREMLKYKKLPIAKCRCEYCKYSQYVPYTEYGFMECSIFKTTVAKYDFCSWAKRKVD